MKPADVKTCRPIITAGVLILIVMIQGCAAPDRRYATDEIVANLPASATASKLDPAALPVPEWADPASQPIIAQGRLVLSIEQAVLLSLARNRELQVARFTPVIAGAAEELARGAFDPELFLDLTYSKEIASETARSTGDRFDVEGEDQDLSIGLRQRLPVGTSLEPSLTYNRSISNRTPEQQGLRLGLTVTQPLLAGLGAAVNLVDVRQARLGVEASLYELQGFVAALVTETETAYWRYVLAGEQLAIFEQSLDVARRQLDEVEQRIEVGALPRNAAAAARAEAARRQQALLEARSILQDRRLRLLRLMNAAGGQQFELEIESTSPPQTNPEPSIDLDRRLARVERMRPDLNEARLRLAQNQLEVVRTRNGLLPRLDLFINLGQTGYAESFGGTLRNLDTDTYDVAAGIRFSTDLGNRQERARDLAARGTRDQAEAALRNLQNLAQLDVRLALNQVQRTRQQIEAGAVTRALQEQTLEAERERFSVGTSTPLLVAQAQRDLLVSQLAEIEAVVAYRVALVSLYQAEGTLLERRGIRLQGTGRRPSDSLEGGLHMDAQT